jgi:hypothetical protein
MNMKNDRLHLVAYYLPQFHKIPENDEWWGTGFTEWTNTTKSKPLFRSHYQPREPLDNNYYNLIDPRTLKWQAELAVRYGIYGFCMYHYWFNGKQLLEKPAEILLGNKDIDIAYCFSWANESWVRSWDGKGSEILIQQEYGDQNDWLSHFEYLLPFFRDSRYIKIDNKPVFLIYRAQDFPLLDDCIAYWDALCKQNGFDGIYFVETLTAFQKEKHFNNSSAAVEFEPGYTRSHFAQFYYKRIQGVLKFFSQHKIKFESYDHIWKSILKRRVDPATRTIPGAFVDWDNSARRSKEPTIYFGVHPDKFRNYLRKQIQRAGTLYRSEFLFINAWNEWAESAYLEPDKRFGFGYLESVMKAINESD